MTSTQKNSTPRCWVIVASRDHVQTGVSGGFCQACHGKAAPLRRMSEGDWVVFYSSKTVFGQSTKCQRFTAIGRVKTGAVYQVECSEDFKPHRRDLEFLPSQEADILPMLKDLSFIADKESWGFPFRWGFFEIPPHDFDLIASKMLSV